jgi:two-component system, OmpR family, response regulator
MNPETPKNILCVEDDEDIRMVLELALSGGGFSAAVCGSGAEALQKVSEFRPDLILLDVMMPGMDGPSTLKALRDMPQTERTPAIFLTAKIQPAEVRDYLASGACAVISKPFDPIKLPERIKEIWRDKCAGK